MNGAEQTAGEEQLRLRAAGVGGAAATSRRGSSSCTASLGWPSRRRRDSRCPGASLLLVPKAQRIFPPLVWDLHPGLWVDAAVSLFGCWQEVKPKGCAMQPSSSGHQHPPGLGLVRAGVPSASHRGSCLQSGAEPVGVWKALELFPASWARRKAREIPSCRLGAGICLLCGHRSCRAQQRGCQLCGGGRIWPLRDPSVWAGFAWGLCCSQKWCGK